MSCGSALSKKRRLSTTTLRSKAYVRWTAIRLQIRLAETAPHFAETFAQPDLFGGVAREVVEAYGDTIMAHPVGTGPFRLVDWRRSSRIVLERNENYREEIFDGSASSEDSQLKTDCICSARKEATAG